MITGSSASSELLTAAKPKSPYPGLRPFEVETGQLGAELLHVDGRRHRAGLNGAWNRDSRCIPFLLSHRRWQVIGMRSCLAGFNLRAMFALSDSTCLLA